MSANASLRGQRRGILESPLYELSGWLLTVDCGTAGCRRERTYSIEELAGTIGPQTTVAAVLRRFRATNAGRG